MNEITEFNKFDAELAEFKKRYDGVIYDLDKPEDDKQARSDRLAIGKVISKLDAVHKEIKAPLAEKVGLIDGRRKEIKDGLLEIQGEIKVQIKNHEEQMAAHAEKLQGMVDAIATLCLPAEGYTQDAKELSDLLAEAKGIVVDDSYEHRKADATLAQVDAVKSLELRLADRVKYEEEQAELERLRAETAAREQADREEQIRKEAEAKARSEAEAKAAVEIEMAQRAQEAAELATKQAEEASQKAAEDAAKAERERIAKEQEEAEKAAEAARQADEAKKAKQAHRAKIHKAAKGSLMQNGYSEKDATNIVNLIIKGEIKNVVIEY